LPERTVAGSSLPISRLGSARQCAHGRKKNRSSPTMVTLQRIYNCRDFHACMFGLLQVIHAFSTFLRNKRTHAPYTVLMEFTAFLDFVVLTTLINDLSWIRSYRIPRTPSFSQDIAMCTSNLRSRSVRVQIILFLTGLGFEGTAEHCA
jgi:hypothetical protein